MVLTFPKLNETLSAGVVVVVALFRPPPVTFLAWLALSDLAGRSWTRLDLVREPFGDDFLGMATSFLRLERAACG